MKKTKSNKKINNENQKSIDESDDYQVMKQTKALEDSGKYNSGTDEEGGRLLGSTGNQDGVWGMEGIGDVQETEEEGNPSGIAFDDEIGINLDDERNIVEDQIPEVKNSKYKPT